MSFQAAISGLKAAENDLNVIGNNVANSATTGFKRSRTEFQDVFAVASVGGATNPTGSGVNTARIAQQFDQGNITNTNSSLDLAVSGQGFFILDNNGVREYTRDGALSVDKNGYIVNAKGSKLQTFGADSIGNITGALGPLQISQADNPPSATKAVSIGANFDANAKQPTVTTFDPLDSNSYNDTTALNVGQWLIYGRYVPFIVTSLLALPYCVYTALRYLAATSLRPGELLLWTGLGILVTVLSFPSAFALAGRFERWKDDVYRAG